MPADRRAAGPRRPPRCPGARSWQRHAHARGRGLQPLRAHRERLRHADLARELCWQQFDAYTPAGPYDEATAKFALQPLINLARLRIRDGDADGGYQIFQSLHDAARSPSGQAVIDGRTVSTTALIVTGNTREVITEWLWTILLTDGLRALGQAGRWADAMNQAQHLDGIGHRLLSGRQITILALADNGQYDRAGTLLRSSSVTEPWEHAVSACLHVLIHGTARPLEASRSAERTRAYLALKDPGHPMFLACLGLAAAELSEPGSEQAAVISEVTRTAADSKDAYIAREVLSSPVAPIVAEKAKTELQDMLRHSGLGQPLNRGQGQCLVGSVRSAAATLAAALTARHRGHLPEPAARPATDPA